LLLGVVMPASASADDITISPATLPNATAGNSYGVVLYAQTAHGVTLTHPITFDVTAGALPDGLSLERDSDSGQATISGYPTLPGTSTFTVTVRDGSQHIGSATYTLTADMPTDTQGLSNFVQHTGAYAQNFVLRNTGCVGNIVEDVLTQRPVIC
jgi:hypothetical protein